MIPPELLAECRKLALTIAPELNAQPFYLLDASELGDDMPEKSDCFGWASPASAPDCVVVAALGSRWRQGVGPAIVLDGERIAESTPPEQFGRVVRRVMVHEVSHVLPPAKPARDRRVTPMMVAHGRKVLAKDLVTPDPDPGEDPWHDDRFIRRAIHCFVRAVTAGFDIPIYRLWGEITMHAEHYLPLLVGEAVRMRDCSFAEIDSTPPPAALLEMYSADVNWHHQLFNR